MTERWIEHFERNTLLRDFEPWPARLALGEGFTAEERAALLGSLARFQLGETGEGVHLRRGAARYGDPRLDRALELFLAEEGRHARLLGKVLDDLGGERITRHWTDAAFVVIRRVTGFRGELLVLLMAEIIGLLYYGLLRDAVRDSDLSRLFAGIHDDEVGHLSFHVAWLGPRLQALPGPLRWAARVGWTTLFRGAVLVASLDHAGALRATGTTPAAFRRRAGAVFDQIVERLFGVQRLTREDLGLLVALGAPGAGQA